MTPRVALAVASPAPAAADVTDVSETAPVPVPSPPFPAHSQPPAWARGRAARWERDHDTAIAAAVVTLATGSRIVAVVGVKGGVGATTVALLAGALLATVPEAHPALVELAADWGTTAALLGNTDGRTVADLLAHLTLAHRAGLGFVQGFLTPWERLPVLLAPRDPALVARLTVVDYARALRLLAAHYGLLLLDCGPSLTHPLTRFALDVADHIVLVTGPDPMARHGARRAITYLTNAGHAAQPPLAVPGTGDGTATPLRARAPTDLTLVLNGVDTPSVQVFDDPLGKEVMPSLNAILSLPRSEPLRQQFAAGSVSVAMLPTATRRAIKAVLAAVLGRLAYSQGDSP